MDKKYAFQDASVGCVPTAAVAAGWRGVSAQGGLVCVYPGMHWAGMYPSQHALGVSTRGCVSQHALGREVSISACPACLPRGMSAQCMLGYTPL